jgi:hypothetical protein
MSNPLVSRIKMKALYLLCYTIKEKKGRIKLWIIFPAQ